MNPVSRRFCGSCGDSLTERLAEFLKRCEDVEKKAAAMAKDGFYVQAIDLVNSVEFVEHSQLREFAKRFERLASRYAQEREQAASDADRVLEETRELEESGHLREALRAAKQIPTALRGRELRGLHDSLEERVKLANRLREELKASLKDKSLEGLLDKAERLNELEPWDAQHRQLVAKLRKKQGKDDKKAAVQCLNEARQYLKACEYRKAEGSLGKVPLEALDDELLAAFRRRRELVWLATQAARAPYLTEATIAVVDRLVERQPHDTRAKQLAESMRKRRKRSHKERPGRPIPWAQPRKPREGEVTFDQTGCAAMLADELGKRGFSPGQFLAAFGLALQGVGRAEYTVDLSPPAKGVLGKIAAVGPRRPAKSAWGIDIGSQSLKAIRLSIDPAAEGGLKLDQVALLAHEVRDKAPPAGDVGISVDDESGNTIEKFSEEYELAGERLVVGLPGAQTLGRFFVAPFLSKSKFAKTVEYETRARIPVDASEVQSADLSWEVEPEEGESDGVAQRRVAIFAATNQHIENRIAGLAAAKPGRIEVTSNCLALANATQFDAEALGIESDEPYAVVSIGAQSTDVVAPGGGDLWFRGLYGGSVAFDRTLVKHFGMSWKVAEKTRRKLDRAEWMYEVDEALDPEFERLADSIRRSLQQYGQESGREVTRVLVCGGAAEQFGLMRTLRSASRSAVEPE